MAENLFIYVFFKKEKGNHIFIITYFICQIIEYVK